MLIPQRSFASGEMAPALWARADFYRYATGLKIARNGWIKKSGGFENRNGTEFIAEVKDSTKAVRYIPFVYSSTQTYSLEFGDQYFRVLKNGVLQTLTAQAITGITNANPGVLTYGGADTYAAGDLVYITGVVGNIANNVNGRWIRVGTVTAGSNIFNMLNLDGTNFNTTSLGTYTSGGTVAEAYTVATTYALADLPNLKFGQSLDVITITHPSYPVREVARTADTAWTIANVTFAPTQVAPAGEAILKVGAAASTSYFYLVTAVNAITFEESLAIGSGTLQLFNGVASMNTTDYMNLTWSAASGAGYYNIYKAIAYQGTYGFIGTTSGLVFNDYGYTPDISDLAPPVAARTIFNTTDAYPSCVLYAQQRRFFGNINSNPETANASRTGLFKNFQKTFPIQEDNAVDFSLAGNQVNSIKHMIDLGNIILLTESGEKVVQGNASGQITPTEINLKQYSYNGSANNPAPIIIDNSAIYVQAGGSIIRDLGFDISVDGYKGNDLTTFSSHLFEGFTITRWAYQKLPHSIIWAVRSDGALLSCTYIKEQQMLAWTRHDFGDALCEDVCSIPNGTTYDVYFVVKRTIGGATKRYMEKLSDRFFSDDKDINFTDCSMKYDGRNTGATTMDLSTATVWVAETLLTLTASVAYFAATDVGNEIHYYDDDDVLALVLEITEYTSTTVVKVRPRQTVLAAYQGAVTNWGKAVDEVTGAWHLEGEDVSIQGDGYTVASPNNPAFAVKTVTLGIVSLNQCYVVIRVGLPYVSDMETLSLSVYNDKSIVDKKVLVKNVDVEIEKTRGVWAGFVNPDESNLNSDDDLLFGLTEFKARNLENYESGVSLLNGKMGLTIESSWRNNGRVFLRQVDPQPMTINSICPDFKL